MIWLFAFSVILSACSSSRLYLVKQPDVTISRDTQWKCLADANSELSSGLKPPTNEEKTLFKGHDVKYFLWWGSLSGPRPVHDEDGHISEAKTIFPLSDEYKVNLAEKYVLCLLNHGYRWPDDKTMQK